MKRTIKAVCGLLLCVTMGVRAQDFGDTPYVQTPQNVVDKMLEVAHVTASDFVIDLGSGDGRMVITAAKRYGARGFGVDLDKRLVALSNRRAAQAGVADRAKFYAQDLYETDLSPASVVTIYLLPEVNLMVRPKLLATLKPGTRVVSHDYDMGDWPPDSSFTMDAPNKPVGRDKKSKVFYWVVPASVAGKWRWRMDAGSGPQDIEVELKQNFLKIAGVLGAGGARVPLEETELSGDRVRFTATVTSGGKPVRYTYAGRVINNAMEGDVEVSRDSGKAKTAWSAARTEVWQPDHVTAPPPTLQPIN
ncbi:MAG: SAM-dependent methyltransferase [Rhodospirillaceae bacterium]